MRVAALYDVHGNLPALEAVLADLERDEVDVLVCGGDVVWGPMPAECLELLRRADSRWVRGNADRGVLAGDTEIDRWCRERLDPDACALAASWATTVALDLPRPGRVLFCHGSPRSDDEILTRATPEGDVAAALGDCGADVVVCGHTHVQLDRRLGDGRRLVNAGSVGMPYEGTPEARWALLGPDVELRRTAYDVDAAAHAILATGFPYAQTMVEQSLRGGIGADEATAYFEARRGA